MGGMAEIFLARQAAMAGFEKAVVIKRLRAELAGDRRIRDMFLTEARIGAQLNHPNIVHVYDVDVHDGIPYIAMEYIIGEQLNQLCQRGISHGKFLPLPHAVELIRQAAAGLGYCHAKRGCAAGPVRSAIAPPEGDPLDIVHLDISPTNLLVTRDGFLKVIDFGIARTNGAPTDIWPGKLSYMSPEQATRASVDQRSDIFSLGIVLYEITVGKRLFRGTASDVIERLTSAPLQPPTFARRDFPPALESIVMRALERYPEDRYQNAYDLADDLEGFLRDQRLQTGPVRIARYLDELGTGASAARRLELIPETRRGSDDDLGFDSYSFDGRANASDASRATDAQMWEDLPQPDDDVAAALHIDVAALRALRTPVPFVQRAPDPIATAAGAPTEIDNPGSGPLLPWLLVSALSLAVVALIAYIVVR